MWTSGTGGQPKPVVGSLMARMNWITSIGHVYRLDAEDRFLAAMPMTHSAGLTFALSHVFYGAPVYPLPRFDTGHAWELLNDGGVTTGLYVPTMLEMLLDDDPEPSRPAGRVRAVVMAGARIRRSTQARLLRRFPGCIYNYYGSTESPSMTVLLPADQEARPESVGRPYMGVELEVRDVRTVEGHSQPLGEIVARNPFAMDRYLGDDGPGPFDSEGWLRTGDLGFLDAEGFLHVIGRESEVIISGGLNVSLPEVERVIAERPEVLDVAVVGLDDEVWGQVPAAVLVVAEGVDETAALEAVERHCRAELADYKRPRHRRVVSTVPRTPSGKPRVPELRRMFTESMSEAGRE
jgi:acyl-CoA synthetase (AMP-forming)/AMP-acid ligase II